MDEELMLFATSMKKLEKYRGKHVAIIRKKVVASGDNAIKVLEKARKKHSKEKPVLAYIPREETLVL